MKNKRIVLAYSGGLDTSVILKWLCDQSFDVYAYCVDIGQNEDLSQVCEKARLLGAKEAVAENCTDEFVESYVFPMLRANAIYEGMYLLGTAIARPLIALKQVEYANRVGASSLAHGATGKGNDQLRFEYVYASLAPEMEIIAPWRTWEFNTRELLLKYALSKKIPISKDKIGEAPFSIDANILHVSSEGKILEDPWQTSPEEVYNWVVESEKAPDKSEIITIKYKQGNAIAINGKAMNPKEILQTLNTLGAKHGVGRIDMLETRTIGTKSRGVYETPGGTILLTAHKAIEHITMDGEAISLRDSLIPKYAKAIYKGHWFSPEREMLQSLIDTSQEYVQGEVRIKLYKGSIIIQGRKSSNSLYDYGNASFDVEGNFTHQDATGFISLTSLRLKQYARQKKNSIKLT